MQQIPANITANRESAFCGKNLLFLRLLSEINQIRHSIELNI